jgi:hypothetical protein
MALEELGFVKCYHMLEVFTHPEHVPVWDTAARGKPVDWESLFRGYAATVDWPGCNFYADYLRLYPDAKVILTVRDPERWYDSALRTIYYVRNAFPAWARLLNPRMRGFTRMLDRLVWVGMFRGEFEDKWLALEVFHAHNEHVKRTVPPDRLLVYEVKEGWGPLCAFLGVPVPEGKPFPHVNDGEEFRARIGRVARIMHAVGYAAMGIVALLLAGLAYWALS